MSKNINLHATGQWTVESPFVVNTEATYTAVALSTIAELQSLYGDVYALIYEPLGIPRVRYELDRINLVKLVTLVSVTQPEAIVPDSFITTYPDFTAIPYTHVVLSISLGAIPDSFPLDELKSNVVELVFNTTGVDSVVKEHQSGNVTKWVDYSEHKVYESNRKVVMGANDGIYSKLKAKDLELANLRERNLLMEQLLKSNGLI